MKRKAALAAVFLALVAVAGRWPFTLEVVPPLRLQVLDERSRPAAGIAVTESWRHYSAEKEGHRAVARTDAAGYVSFPGRTVRTFAFRVIAVSANEATAGVHASLGPHASMTAYGGDRHSWAAADYRPGRPLPTILRLPGLTHAEEPGLWITGGSIVDPDSAAPPLGADVLVQGERIVAVRAPGSAPPPGARVIDAAGKFLVPGLWDMHAHLAALTEIGRAPEHYVGFGVLALRDCGSLLDPLLALRRELDSGRRIGPHLLIAGPALNGESFAPFQRQVRSTEEARAAVRELAAAGVDFIKTHRATSREAFFAMVDEARRHGLQVAGHVPLALSWIEAAEAGMKSMEHAQTLLENEMSAARTPAASPEEAIDRLDGARGDAIFAALVHAGASFDPTIHRYAESVDEKPELAKRRRNAYSHLKAYVLRAHQAGVPILAGTDFLDRHGEMLLREIERLREIGLTPREALIAATTNPARLMNRPDLGKIAEGGTASFLIVSGDPTLDLRHLRSLEAVLLRGRWIDRAALERLRESK